MSIISKNIDYRMSFIRTKQLWVHLLAQLYGITCLSILASLLPIFLSRSPETKFISMLFCPRDLENENCISFVTKLLYYARQDERSDEFDVDSFYKTHRDDLIAMSRTNFQLLNFYFSQSTINEL